MFPELFSKRYNLRPTPEGLISEDVPESARIGLYYLLENYWEYIDKRSLYHEICVALRIPRNTRDSNENAYSSMMHLPVESVILECEWWRFYDICEITYRLISSSIYYSNKAKNFMDEVNKLFLDEQLGVEIKNGKVEKSGSGFIDAKVKEARYLLKEPEFKGADEHFEKAIKALNERPNPDVENCVKDAVAAIESVGRIIVGDEKALLDDIIKDMAKKEIIPKPLDQTIQKIYAYRGDQPGVAHGLVGASKVTIDEAEFILAFSAAAIIYLAKKRNQT